MKGLLVLCLSVVAVSGVALTGRTKSEIGLNTSPSLTERDELADPALYTTLFRHLNHLKKRAEASHRSGKDGSGFQRRFQRRLVVDEDQFEQLSSIAFDWESQTAELDKKAEQAIEMFKRTYRPGKIPEGQVVPPPPAELVALQDQRNQVTRSAINRLKSTLGAREFIRFEEILKLQLRPESPAAAHP